MVSLSGVTFAERRYNMRLPKLSTLDNRQYRAYPQVDMDRMRFYATHPVVADCKQDWKNALEDIDDEIDKRTMAFEKYIDDLYDLQDAILCKLDNHDTKIHNS
jgi:hypothetical protein